MFASGGDSTKFFSEFFKGFPGTEDYGVKDVNPFFTKETIEKMEDETKKHKSYANQPSIDAAKNALENWHAHSLSGKDKPKIPNPEYQFPGIGITTKDKEGKEIGFYSKNGGTSGYISRLVFNPKTGVDISMISQENVTLVREKLADQEKDSKTVKEDRWVKKLDLQKSEEKSFVETTKESKERNSKSGNEL